MSDSEKIIKVKLLTDGGHEGEKFKDAIGKTFNAKLYRSIGAEVDLQDGMGLYWPYYKDEYEIVNKEDQPLRYFGNEHGPFVEVEVEGVYEEPFLVLTKSEDSPLKLQYGGNHYKSKGIQPIEYILANDLGFCEGNVVKYITRYKDKNGIEDLKKARHYLDFLIEEENKKKGPQGN